MVARINRIGKSVLIIHLCIKRQFFSLAAIRFFDVFTKYRQKYSIRILYIVLALIRGGFILWVVFPIKNGYIQYIVTMVVAYVFNEIKALL